MNPWGDDDTFFQACWYHLRPRMRDKMWITALSLTSCVTLCQFILTLLCFNILFSEIKYLMKLSGSLKNEQADMWSRGWCRTSALWVCTLLVPSFLPHDFQWTWGIIVRYGISCLYNSYACCSSWLSYNIDIIKLFQFKHMEQLRGDLLNIKKKEPPALLPTLTHSLIVPGWFTRSQIHLSHPLNAVTRLVNVFPLTFIFKWWEIPLMSSSGNSWSVQRASFIMESVLFPMAT